MSLDDCPPDSDYNAFPCTAVHAEANAIFRAGVAGCRGATLYITCAPCQQCINLIKISGISRVVYPGSECNDQHKWEPQVPTVERTFLNKILRRK